MDNNKLRTDSIVTDPKCLLCGRYTPDGILLIDGTRYDQSCYDFFINRISEIENQLYEFEQTLLFKNLALEKAKKLHQKSRGTFNSIKASLGMRYLVENNCLREIVQIEDEIKTIEGLISQWEKVRNIKKAKITAIYDYWPTYPPDWEERTQKIKEKRETCEVCNGSGRLHVHHKIKVSSGGDHTENNLVLMCENCHGEIHHEDFSGKKFVFQERASSFAQKLNMINSAISEEKKINFKYTKFNGEKSNRTLKPELLKKVGKSLCVRGYCYLRNDYRTFAIRRMKNIRFVN